MVPASTAEAKGKKAQKGVSKTKVQPLLDTAAAKDGLEVKPTEGDAEERGAGAGGRGAPGRGGLAESKGSAPARDADGARVGGVRQAGKQVDQGGPPLAKARRARQRSQDDIDLMRVLGPGVGMRFQGGGWDPRAFSPGPATGVLQAPASQPMGAGGGMRVGGLQAPVSQPMGYGGGPSVGRLQAPASQPMG